MANAEIPAMLTKTALKERGWTDALIRDHLGAPDDEAENPYYRCAAPVLLFDLDRVKAAEAASAFQIALEKAQRRREAGKRVAETKRAALLARLQRIKVKVPDIPREQLVRAACDHYNAHQRSIEQWDFRSATPDSDPAFIERICVNYLRHSRTNYDLQLEGLFRQVGRGEGYVLIKGRVLDAIATKHSWLAMECERQKESVWE